MNGRELANGEVETWPDDERAENILLRADGSISKFDDAKPFMVSGKVEPPTSRARFNNRLHDMVDLLKEREIWFAWRPVRLTSGKWAWWRLLECTRSMPKFGGWGSGADAVFPWEYHELFRNDSNAK